MSPHNQFLHSAGSQAPVHLEVTSRPAPRLQQALAGLGCQNQEACLGFFVFFQDNLLTRKIQ